jgi:hypothetical protein
VNCRNVETAVVSGIVWQFVLAIFLAGKRYLCFLSPCLKVEVEVRDYFLCIFGTEIIMQASSVKYSQLPSTCSALSS